MPDSHADSKWYKISYLQYGTVPLNDHVWGGTMEHLTCNVVDITLRATSNSQVYFSLRTAHAGHRVGSISSQVYMCVIKSLGIC